MMYLFRPTRVHSFAPGAVALAGIAALTQATLDADERRGGGPAVQSGFRRRRRIRNRIAQAATTTTRTISAYSEYRVTAA